MRTTLVASILAFLMVGGTAATADPVAPVNPRTSIAIVSLVPGMSTGTSNSSESRAALSIIKVYLVAYALRHGDGSASDRELGQRAIRLSDNNAATALDDKYPDAIAATATEFGLTGTRRGAFWGESYTSARDAAEFLAAEERTDPLSPLLAWMATASPIAADGTAQNWGTSRLPAVIGSKWGWSDEPAAEVASASFGPGFAVAAFTFGDADTQNADLTEFMSR
ncbi:hypothetical protein NONO_c67220 [Nocardia nova SH22a]|uniref:Serine hydrolase n=1 Tax=Nocardia nova SH22a TaxID=1415166 RepID=W5TQU0_9NOCA|nr:serine hydrolase [Nocardia nova]AHH21489.1 hypothetical protein NONO_c67220 [Nocardia nova SH22a]